MSESEKKSVRVFVEIIGKARNLQCGEHLRCGRVGKIGTEQRVGLTEGDKVHRIPVKPCRIYPLVFRKSLDASDGFEIFIEDIE